MWTTVRTTIIGGIFFLIPLAFIAVVLSKAFQLSMKIAQPLGALLPVQHIGGVALASVLGVLILVMICFVAGLLARQARIAVYSRRLDEMMTAVLPGYAIAKSMIGGLVQARDAMEALKPVLVQMDDHSQLAFEVERDDNVVVVFLPGAPAAWSGSTVLVGPNRVTAVDMAPHEVAQQLRVLGRGGAVRFGPVMRGRGPV